MVGSMVNSKTTPLLFKLIALVVITLGSVVTLHWLYCTVYGREVLLQCAPLQEPDRTDCNVCKGATAMTVGSLTALLSTLLALKVPVKDELREFMADREADREWDRLLKERELALSGAEMSREKEESERDERVFPSSRVMEKDVRVDTLPNDWEMDYIPSEENL